MVTWNEPEMTARALGSIRDKSNYPHRLIVVDNNSSPETVSMLERACANREYGEMTLVKNAENSGWLRAANQGLRQATAPYVCLLNNDILAGQDWLKNMIGALEKIPDAGLANPHGDERSENNGIKDVDSYAAALRRRNAGRYTELSHCTGFCLLLKREVIEKVGVFDLIYEGGYFEDVDFSRRARQAGYRCVQCDDAFVLHYQSVSFKKTSTNKKALIERNRKIFEERWGQPRRLLVLAHRPAADDVLSLARMGHTVYVIRNKYCHPALLPLRHANIRFLDSLAGRISEPLYFRYQAWYLARKKRIDETRRIR
jgi:GT2 family glycosyltransferase